MATLKEKIEKAGTVAEIMTTFYSLKLLPSKKANDYHFQDIDLISTSGINNKDILSVRWHFKGVFKSDGAKVNISGVDIENNYNSLTSLGWTTSDTSLWHTSVASLRVNYSSVGIDSIYLSAGDTITVEDGDVEIRYIKPIDWPRKK